MNGVLEIYSKLKEAMRYFLTFLKLKKTKNFILK